MTFIDILKSSNYIFLIFIEDSQGNINPYAVTSYAMNYKDEADHGSFWRENKHNNGQLNTTGLIFRFEMEIQ